MKIHRTLSMLILAFSAFAAFAEVPLPKEKCEELAGDITIVDFSSDTSGNSIIYNEMGLNNKQGYEYLDKTRTELHDRMKNYCTNSSTVEGMQKVFHTECSLACQNNSKAMFKKPLLGENTKALKADTACMIVCNRAHKKFDLLRQGAQLGKLAATPDCNGAVSNSKREGKTRLYDSDDEMDRYLRKLEKTKSR